MKRKMLYSDIPRPYDEDAARLVRRVGILLLTLLMIAGCIIAINIGG
jgi:hypothetical protein